MSFWELLTNEFQEILLRPVPSLMIVLNLILIESLLSVDNAAVLATMVLDLPKDQRRKALRYGILGAYIFRGICLVFAAILIQIWWFKPLGGAYLLILAIRHFTKKPKPHPDHPDHHLHLNERGWFYRKTLGLLGPFWATVVLVELMDLAFSIDNVIAANAYTHNLILIWTGVFIGILAMRFVAQYFIRLMERYPFLEHCAYIVILLLGFKLLAATYTHFYPCTAFTAFMEGPQPCLISQGKNLPEGEHPMVWGDTLISILGMALFIVPIITSRTLGWPRAHVVAEEAEDGSTV